MTTLIAVVTWLLRIAGFVSTAEKLWATHQSGQVQKTADDAEKVIIDEDHRKLDIAARPDRSPDDILDRMQSGED